MTSRRLFPVYYSSQTYNTVEDLVSFINGLYGDTKNISAEYPAIITFTTNINLSRLINNPGWTTKIIDDNLKVESSNSSIMNFYFKKVPKYYMVKLNSIIYGYFELTCIDLGLFNYKVKEVETTYGGTPEALISSIEFDQAHKLITFHCMCLEISNIRK